MSLYEILSFWYKTIDLSIILSSSEIDDLWKNIWFAKNDQQQQIDTHLIYFEKYINNYIIDEPTNLYEKIAFIILYDQIPRNIYRNTSNAYAYDHISRKYAREIMLNSDIFELLPIHFKITTIICMIHSENIEDHELVNQNIHFINEYRNLSYKLKQSLKQIIRNHSERIQLFGRIPERNKFLNRVSTIDEKVYLNALY